MTLAYPRATDGAITAFASDEQQVLDLMLYALASKDDGRRTATGLDLNVVVRDVV
jgi:hypothetical protein